MKHFLLLSFICLSFTPVFAQSTSPDSMISVSSGIRSKLVGLALQNPDLEVADHQINIAKYNLKAAQGWWANNISLSFNANEFTLKRLEKTTPTTNGQYYPYYPFYNVGLNIPIGGIFSQPATVKAAREQVTIRQAERTGIYRQTRAAVLTAYENYLSSKELYTVESQLAESAYNDYLQAKEKFRNGQISVADYNASTDQYQTALKGRISAENSFNLTKIELEALIGVPISQVLTDTEIINTPKSNVKAR